MAAAFDHSGDEQVVQADVLTSDELGRPGGELAVELVEEAGSGVVAKVLRGRGAEDVEAVVLIGGRRSL